MPRRADSLRSGFAKPGAAKAGLIGPTRKSGRAFSTPMKPTMEWTPKVRQAVNP